MCDAMMTLSSPLSAGQAKKYYDAEYTNARESYYSEDESIGGEWFGKLAKEWGLEGEVDKEAFARLTEGQDPRTGEQLIRHVSAKEYENQFGEKVKNSEHRAGYDATFSAPKSVSLAALVGNDDRIREAHRTAVKTAMAELENYAQARMGGKTPAQTSAKLVAALFEHDSARPDKATGYAAPQLHTHAVIFNLTQLDNGQVKPLQPIELYRSQKYGTAIYRAVLSEQLQKLGYEVEVDPRTGAPEIKGFSQEYLIASSPRRKQIEQEAAEIKGRYADQGITVKDGAGLNQAAAKLDRKSKRYDRTEMRARHEEMDAKFEHQAVRTVDAARERGPLILKEEETQKRAQTAVTFARQNAGAREAVVDKRQVMVDALRRNVTFTTHGAVVQELNRRVESGEFIRIQRFDKFEELTTSQMLALERSNIHQMLAGRNTQEPMMERKDASRLVKEIFERKGKTSSFGQYKAVGTILVSRDRVLGLEGLAGTGKTTALAILREAAERQGFIVQGLAPTGRAADKLAESGIKTTTLQGFLREPQFESMVNVAANRRLYVLDESSLSDTRNLHLFLQKAGPQARILLVGDTAQHQAVEAGAPFEQLIKAGIRTTRLDKILRQRTNLKKPVELLSQREVLAAVTMLESQGRITEITDDGERLKALAGDYVNNSKGTLIISPANSERVAINSIIHRQLQERGLVSAADHKLTILVNRQDMTGPERTFALAYVPQEDIIRYNTTSKLYGVRPGDYGRVLANSHKENTITVRLDSGREITYNPERLSGVSVYREAQREFAAGDRIQFRAPFAEGSVKNSELGTIKEIADGKMIIRLDKKRDVTVNLDRFSHLDHGYAVTSHSSQGQTVNRVLVNAETTETDLLLNQRMAYVAISRARFEARIYTDSLKDLGPAFDRERNKEIGLEALNESYASTPSDPANRVFSSAQVNDEDGRKNSNSNHRWLRVTLADPCPVCHTAKNCAVSSDGETAYCRRIQSERQGRDGGWLHNFDKGRDLNTADQCPSDSGVPVTTHETLQGPATPFSGRMHQLNERLVLGQKLAASLNEKYAAEGLEQALEQRDVRRYLVMDQTTGVRRKMSVRDVEQRAMNVANRAADEYVPVFDGNGSASPHTLRELRDSEYSRQIEKHSSTIDEILNAHAAEVRKLTFCLRNAYQTNLRITPAARGIEASFHAAGAQLPVPIIQHEKLNELQVKAIRSRDVSAFERLEHIRSEIPYELGGPERDTFSFARLRGQSFLAESNVAVAEKRVEDFEKSRHFAKFEIGGVRWSLAGVDRQQRLAEREIEFHRGTVSAYRKRLYAGLQNPSTLYGIGEYKERADAAKEGIANARDGIRNLQPIRTEVKRLIEEHRAELEDSLRDERHITGTLERSVERETELRIVRGQELPRSEFNGSELKRLEENAITLRDPTLLFTAQREMESHHGQTQAGVEKLAERAAGRAEAADVSVQDLTERMQKFSENRQFLPVIFMGADGEEKTASLQDLQPRTLAEKVFSYFSPKDRLEINAVNQALDQHYADLLAERDSLEQFTSTVRNISTGYQQQLLSVEHHIPAGVDRQMSQPEFTAREIANVENFAAHQSDAGVRAQLENVARSALTTGRVGDFTELSPNAGQGNHQLHGFDPAQPPSRTDDYLEAAKNTLDKVAAQAGPEYGTLNEAGAVAETEAGSEAWAALL
jgi:conjugative relaxase-like TrwC/TraI family protein